jgi:hypothetical protein
MIGSMYLVSGRTLLLCRQELTTGSYEPLRPGLREPGTLTFAEEAGTLRGKVNDSYEESDLVRAPALGHKLSVPDDPRKLPFRSQPERNGPSRAPQR